MIDFSKPVQIRQCDIWEDFQVIYYDKRWPNQVYGIVDGDSSPKCFHFRNKKSFELYVLWLDAKNEIPFPSSGFNSYKEAMDHVLEREYPKSTYTITGPHRIDFND